MTMPGDAMDRFEEFVLRLLVQAGKDAATRCNMVHDTVPLAFALHDAATAIETTLDVWRAMEKCRFRDLFKPIEFGPSWEKIR